MMSDPQGAQTGLYLGAVLTEMEWTDLRILMELLIWRVPITLNTLTLSSHGQHHPSDMGEMQLLRSNHSTLLHGSPMPMTTHAYPLRHG